MQINNNDLIRQNFCNYIYSYLENEDDIEEAIENYMAYIYTNIYNKNIDTSDILILITGFLDAYKIYSFNQKSNVKTLINDEVLGQLSEISSLEDIINNIIDNEDFLKDLLTSILNFNETNDLGKITLIKSLSDEENETLQSIFPSHQDDLDNYDIDITAEFLVEEYKKLKKFQNSELLIDYEEANILSLVGFIKQNIHKNEDYGKNLFNTLFLTDYALSKYIHTKKIHDDINIDRINLYENNSIDTLFGSVYSNEDYLKDLIYTLIDVHVKHSCDNTKVSPEILKKVNVSILSRKLT